jgi:hypothetical protein
LTRLAGQEALIYRPFARGVTLSASQELADPQRLRAIAARFSDRYDLFERRLQAMLDYVQLRPGQGRCRSAYLVNYLTNRSDTPRCGKCDLCSPTSESLPWDPGVRLYGQPVGIDLRLAVLGAVRDHDGWFGAWTVERVGRDYWIPAEAIPAAPAHTRLAVAAVRCAGPRARIDGHQDDEADGPSDTDTRAAATAIPDAPASVASDHATRWTTALRTIHLLEGFLPIPADVRPSYSPAPRGGGRWEACAAAGSRPGKTSVRASAGCPRAESQLDSLGGRLVEVATAVANRCRALRLELRRPE